MFALEAAPCPIFPRSIRTYAKLQAISKNRPLPGRRPAGGRRSILRLRLWLLDNKLILWLNRYKLKLLSLGHILFFNQGGAMIHRIVSPESLGAAIREERKIKGLTQTTVGNPVGIDQTTVSKVEQGSPGTRLDTLFRLLAVLDLEMVLQPRQPIKSNGQGW